MILFADEFTSDYSRALEQSLRDKQLNFAIRNTVALRFNYKFLVSDTKIPFNNSFSFDDYIIRHSNKTKIRDRCCGNNKITTQG